MPKFGDTLYERMEVRMDSITNLIKNEIKKQFRSVKRFSDASGIPYSTLTNALSKGVGGTSYDTVCRICELLKIKQAADSEIVLFNDEFHEIYSKLLALDEQGVHTVTTILDVEFRRCMSDDTKRVVKAFNGIGLASRSDDAGE